MMLGTLVAVCLGTIVLFVDSWVTGTSREIGTYLSSTVVPVPFLPDEKLVETIPLVDPLFSFSRLRHQCECVRRARRCENFLRKRGTM